MIPPGLALAAPCQRAGPGSGAEAAPSLPSEALSLSSSWSLVVLKALPRDSALKDGPFPIPDPAPAGCPWGLTLSMEDGASPERPSLMPR